MPKIEKVSWAKIRINGQDYWQVLIIGEKVISREIEKIKKKYGTDHVISVEEQKLLLSGKPEVVLVANGWSGLLKMGDGFKKKVEKAGVKLRVVLTPKIVEEYNRLGKEGKKINALIHTTC